MNWPKCVILSVIIAGGIVSGIFEKWEVVSGCVVVGILAYLLIDD